ncbi:MAG: ammonium transporter [Pseudobacteriovorax sp.]|nr:ammonium transporter [Pseudobacteriovorax sp.]
MNYIYVLMASALVFLMQAGFMCLESGMCRAKNSINIAIKNLCDFIIAIGAFWLIGFGLMFGDSLGGMLGSSEFAFGTATAWVALFFVFQAVFCGTAATIQSGVIAERTSFAAYLMISLIVSMLIYPIFGHWAWGSFLNGEGPGWLEKLGFIDFAGSTVVHSIGAWVGMAAAIVIGPREGRFDSHGQPQKIQPHNLVLTYLGTIILVFGWFGFNCGSTLAADVSIAGIALNTVLGGAFGGVVATGCSMFFSKNRIPDPESVANGVLAGLVSITAGCASVAPLSAVIIGGLGGIVYWHASIFVERVLKIDDVVGAIAVHGFAGAWGTLAVGFFATAEALGDMGRLTLIGVQALGVISAFVWSFGAGLIIYTTINKFVRLRVDLRSERIGLNVAEHGASSSLLDLAKNISVATREHRFDRSLEVQIEPYTEMGELGAGFNSLLKTVRESLVEAEQQTRRANHAKANAEKATENARELLQSLEFEKEQSVLKRAQYLEETTSQVKGVFDGVQENFDLVKNTKLKLEESVKLLDERAQQVFKVLEEIKAINFRTEIISLNAFIEANRAGHHGKSFQVVAREVQNLSSQAQSTSSLIDMTVHEIESELTRVQEDINSQHQCIDETQRFFDQALRLIEDLSKDDISKMAA